MDIFVPINDDLKIHKITITNKTDNASIKIDFPAPVSPESIFKPDEKVSSLFSINAKLRIDKSVII